MAHVRLIEKGKMVEMNVGCMIATVAPIKELGTINFLAQISRANVDTIVLGKGLDG